MPNYMMIAVFLCKTIQQIEIFIDRKILSLHNPGVMSNKSFDYSKELEKYCKDSNIKSFDYSKFSKLEKIGRGGFAIVYSTVFLEEKYALKSLNNNLSLDYEQFKQFVREKKFIDATLSDYADIYIKCCSSELDQRPTLNEISKKLENLSENTTVEFIKNCINKNNQQTVQPILNYLERLDSSNIITENINMEKHHEGNQDGSENNTHSKNDTVDELNELDETTSNNNLAALNEAMNLFTRSCNSSEEVIQIPIKTINELWSFFVIYFLNTGLLWVFQPRSRDLEGYEHHDGPKYQYNWIALHW
ncbi:11510_t:CDS:2 [Dentiscutata erythropus]|uniref:11510_t:CDS:1 n=1 Tax=Dentiscutata erythropus TaxID=1348616 RepID=A0A9N9CAG0_9GLOM|nr:11510_t:CDS:2 [Dentiscutata erythropus]